MKKIQNYILLLILASFLAFLSGCTQNSDGTVNDPLGIGQASHDTMQSFADDIQQSASNTQF